LLVAGRGSGVRLIEFEKILDVGGCSFLALLAERFITQNGGTGILNSAEVAVGLGERIPGAQLDLAVELGSAAKLIRGLSVLALGREGASQVVIGLSGHAVHADDMLEEGNSGRGLAVLHLSAGEVVHGNRILRGEPELVRKGLDSEVILVESAVFPPQGFVEIGLAGGLFDGEQILVDGVLMVVGLGIDDGAELVEAPGGWIEFVELGVTLFGNRHVRLHAIIDDILVRGIKFRGMIQRAHSQIRMADIEFDDSQPGVRLLVLRIILDGPFEIGDGIAGVAALIFGNAEEKVGAGGRRIDAEGCSDVRDGVRQFAVA